MSEEYQDPSDLHRRSRLLHLRVGMFFGAALFAFSWWISPSETKVSVSLGVLGIFLVLFLTILFFGQRAHKRHRNAFDLSVRRWNEEGRLLSLERQRIRSLMAERLPSLAGTIPDAALIDVFTLLVDEIERRDALLSVHEDNTSRVGAVLASVPRLSGLLQAHLSQTNATTESAALEIMAKLSDLNKDVVSLQGTLGETTTVASRLFDHSQVKVQENQQMLAGLNGYQIEMESQVKSTIQVLTRQMAGLKPFLELIRDVNAKTNVLAINAAIEAARAGVAGRGFAVVATEVRSLSRQVASAAESVETSVKEITETVAVKLGAITNLMHGEDERQGFGSLILGLPRLSQDFSATVELLKNFAVTTQTNVNEIQSAIVDVMAIAQFQDITRQQIEQVQKGLSLTDAHLHGVVGALQSGSVPDDIASLDRIAAELSQSYTMMTQRKVHQVVLAGKDEEQEPVRPDIELF